MSYGATTDPWSFADTTMHLQSSTADPSDGGEAQCIDSNGDVSASTQYDTANATVSASYMAMIKPSGSGSSTTSTCPIAGPVPCERSSAVPPPDQPSS